MAVPTKNELLLAWGGCFLGQVTGREAEYLLTTEQIAVLSERFNEYQAAQQEVSNALEAGMIGGPIFRKRDQCKARLLERARPLYSWVQQCPDIPGELKLKAGVDPIGHRVRRVGPPDRLPQVELMPMSARRVKVRVRDLNPSSPRRVLGAAILTHVGPFPPADRRQWTFETNTMRQVTTLHFESSHETTRVWITACYFNDRGENGPFAKPMMVDLVPYMAACENRMQAA